VGPVEEFLLADQVVIVEEGEDGAGGVNEVIVGAGRLGGPVVMMLVGLVGTLLVPTAGRDVVLLHIGLDELKEIRALEGGTLALPPLLPVSHWGGPTVSKYFWREVSTAPTVGSRKVRGMMGMGWSVVGIMGRESDRAVL
jgi:hypothetical protein